MALLLWDAPIIDANGDRVWAVSWPDTKEWDESQHPRDDVGRFAEGGLAHGTSSQHLDSILQHGLQASKAGLTWGVASDKGRTYVASSAELAVSWAFHAAKVTGGTPALLEITIPPAERHRLAVDLEPDPSSGQPPSTFKFAGDIPPSWIVKAWVANDAEVGIEGRPSWPGWKYPDTPGRHPEHWTQVKTATETVYVGVVLPAEEVAAKAWDESLHPRAPAGDASGGEFTGGGGGGGTRSAAEVAATPRAKDMIQRLSEGYTRTQDPPYGSGFLLADGQWINLADDGHDDGATLATAGVPLDQTGPDPLLYFLRESGALRSLEQGGQNLVGIQAMVDVTPTPAQWRAAVRAARSRQHPLVVDVLTYSPASLDDTPVAARSFDRPTVDAVVAWYEAAVASFHETKKKSIAKAPTPDALAVFAERLAPTLRRAFLEAMAATHSAVDLEALAQALQHGDVTLAEATLRLDLLGRTLEAAWVPILRQGFLLGAQAAVAALKPVVNIGFSLISPTALRWAQTYGAQLVTQITEDTRASLRGIVERGFTEGIDVRDLAKEIRPLIGLTAPHARAVENYRARLLADGEEIGGKVDRYAAKLLKLRANTIARHEVLVASGMGQAAQWKAAVAEGYLDGGTVRKRFIITEDERTCELCAPLDGLEVGINDVFPGGYLHPPIHITCRCSLGLVFPPVEKRWVVKWDESQHPRGEWLQPVRPKGTKAWEESEHPREPAGSEAGGEFTAGGGGGKTFASKAEADTWGRSTQGWVASLTPAEIRGLSYYTTSVGINEKLRTGKPMDESQSWGTQEDFKREGRYWSQADAFRAFDPIFAKPEAVLQETVVTHRAWSGVGTPTTKKVGATFIDKGYTSTALVEAEIDVFRSDPNSGKVRGIDVKILVLKGARAIYVGVEPSNNGDYPRFDRGRARWFADNSELLLNRGTRYRVVEAVHPLPNGRRGMTLEVVP